MKEKSKKSSIHVGFIGLGLMGTHMAAHIHAAGFPLQVYNRTAGRADAFARQGIGVAATPKILADTSDVIITMVTAARDVEDVLFGLHGVTSSGKKGVTVIDMSTIGPQPAKAIGSRLNSAGMEFLDAPVTGGTYGAQSGELTIFAGGKKAVFESMKPVLTSMGKNIHYMGAVGSGQAIKMINNYLIAGSLVALSESMILADIMGLPRAKAAEALVTTPAVSLAMIRKLPNYVNGTYPMNFTIKNMYKDLSLARDAAGERDDLTMLNLVLSLYGKAADGQLTEEDYSRIIDVIGDKA